MLGSLEQPDQLASQEIPELLDPKVVLVNQVELVT